MEHGVLGSIAVSICLVLAMLLTSQALLAKAALALVAAAILLYATHKAVCTSSQS